MPVDRIEDPRELISATLDAGGFNAYEPEEYRNILVKASGKPEQSQFLDCTDCIYRDWMVLDKTTSLLDSLTGKQQTPEETNTPVDRFHAFMKNLPPDADVLESIKTAFGFINEEDEKLLKLGKEFDQHPALGILLSQSQPEYNRVADKISPALIGTLSSLPSQLYSGQDREAQAAMKTLQASVSRDELPVLEAYFAKLETVGAANTGLVEQYKGAYDLYYTSAMTASYMYDALKTSDIGKKHFKGN